MSSRFSHKDEVAARKPAPERMPRVGGAKIELAWDLIRYGESRNRSRKTETVIRPKTSNPAAAPSKTLNRDISFLSKTRGFPVQDGSVDCALSVNARLGGQAESTARPKPKRLTTRNNDNTTENEGKEKKRRFLKTSPPSAARRIRSGTRVGVPLPEAWVGLADIIGDQRRYTLRRAEHLASSTRIVQQLLLALFLFVCFVLLRFKFCAAPRKFLLHGFH